MKTGKAAGCAVIVFLFLTPFLSAQVLPSVDIDTAKTQIDQFVRENELIQERITELLQTNEERKVVLLSGGLDSFVGAIDALEQTDDEVYFVSHYYYLAFMTSLSIYLINPITFDSQILFYLFSFYFFT